MAEKVAQTATRSATTTAHESANAEPCAGHAVGWSRSLTAAYVLGLGVQVLFWCLVFLALAAAIGVGGHLSEFRYVGF